MISHALRIWAIYHSLQKTGHNRPLIIGSHSGRNDKLPPSAFIVIYLPKIPMSTLFSGQHGRQKPEFGLHFRGIGDSIGDFLAKEFAIPLAKPVNGHLQRSL